MSGWVSIGNSG